MYHTMKRIVGLCEKFNPGATNDRSVVCALQIRLQNKRRTGTLHALAGNANHVLKSSIFERVLLSTFVTYLARSCWIVRGQINSFHLPREYSSTNIHVSGSARSSCSSSFVNNLLTLSRHLRRDKDLWSDASVCVITLMVSHPWTPGAQDQQLAEPRLPRQERVQLLVDHDCVCADVAGCLPSATNFTEHVNIDPSALTTTVGQSDISTTFARFLHATSTRRFHR